MHAKRTQEKGKIETILDKTYSSNNERTRVGRRNLGRQTLIERSNEFLKEAREDVQDTVKPVGIRKRLARKNTEDALIGVKGLYV